MNTNTVVSETKAKIKAALNHFEEDLKTVRTGRAHPSMLDGVMVEAYGTKMPLIQVGNVTTPEAQLLQVTPFDPGNLSAVSAAIRDNPNLGLNPMDDGRVVRVPVPPLTEERRREFVKVVSNKAEDAMISLRNIRREAMDTIDSAKKAKEVGEDDAKRLSEQVEQEMNSAKTEVDTLAKAKEQEILTV